MDEQISPDAILQLGMGFWGSKTLLTAIELGLFSELAKGPHDARTLQRELRLQARGARDFFDALVSLGMLERVGEEYRNTPATDLFLDRAKPSYAGTLLEMASARSYPFWGSLTEALRTGHPQNEAKAGENSFAVLYKDPDRLGQFLHAMTVLSMGDARAIAEKFPWERYQTVIDIGAAEGCVPVHVALRHPRLSGGGFDLPATGPIFERYVGSFGLTNRLRFYPGDFFVDPTAVRRRAHHGPHPARLEPRREAGTAPQGVRGAPRKRRSDRLRHHHRRRPPGKHLRPAQQPEHAHRDPGRFRLHRCRLPVVDGPRRLPGHLRRAASGARFHGGRDQIDTPTAAARVPRDAGDFWTGVCGGVGAGG